MSCLARLLEGPIAIVSCLAMLSVLPWGNCKTYSRRWSWSTLCVSKLQLEAWLWYFDHQKEHWKRNANYFLINYPTTVVWVNIMILLAPLSKWICICCPFMYIMLYLSLRNIYSLYLGIITFSFPLSEQSINHNVHSVGLFNPCFDLYDLTSNNSLLT